MPTIKDVAKLARVSVGTVSHYLNGSARVAEGTAERIREAIDALGYRVDLGARGLRAGHTRTVGLVLPNISNPFFGELARAIEHALTERGYQTFLCDSNDDASREDAYLANLVSRRVEGVLMVYSEERVDARALLDELSVPLVFVDRDVEGGPSVSSDNRLGGRLAAQHLLEQGHRRIGVLFGQPEVRNVRERVEGFREELARGGVTLEPRFVIEGTQELAFGAEVERLLTAGEPAPTAVFATNDIIAIGAWQKLLGLGRRIPTDISLVGFDDIELSRLLIPPLTTVAQDVAAMGRRASELLLEITASGSGGTPPDPVWETIAPRLVVRESTAPPAHAGGFEAGAR